MTYVHLERILPRSAKRAFEAWLDPEALSVFMCAAPGMTISKVELDPRVGGAFLIVMTLGERDLPHRGEYLEMERHTRLAVTWRSHHAGEGSRVTLTFEPLGPRKTRLILEHFGLEESARESHVAGWTRILDLAGTLAE